MPDTKNVIVNHLLAWLSTCSRYFKLPRYLLSTQLHTRSEITFTVRHLISTPTNSCDVLVSKIPPRAVDPSTEEPSFNLLGIQRVRM